jgi:hypothetical protein
MGKFVEQRSTGYYVVNPVDDEKNLVDRWTIDQTKAFFKWLSDLQSDLESLNNTSDPENSVARMLDLHDEGDTFKPLKRPLDSKGKSSGRSRPIGQPEPVSRSDPSSKPDPTRKPDQRPEPELMPKPDATPKPTQDRSLAQRPETRRKGDANREDQSPFEVEPPTPLPEPAGPVPRRREQKSEGPHPESVDERELGPETETWPKGEPEPRAVLEPVPESEVLPTAEPQPEDVPEAELPPEPDAEFAPEREPQSATGYELHRELRPEARLGAMPTPGMVSSMADLEPKTVLDFGLDGQSAFETELCTGLEVLPQLAEPTLFEGAELELELGPQLDSGCVLELGRELHIQLEAVPEPEPALASAAQREPGKEADPGAEVALGTEPDAQVVPEGEPTRELVPEPEPTSELEQRPEHVEEPLDRTIDLRGPAVLPDLATELGILDPSALWFGPQPREAPRRPRDPGLDGFSL